MKKVLLSLIALFCFTAAMAQVRIQPGVRGGFTTSDISDTRGDNRKSFYAGALLNFRFAKWYALQPELNYARQGMTVQYFNGFDPVLTATERDWKLDYVGLTVNNRFYVYKGLNLQIGPFLEFLVNSENVNPRSDVDTGIVLGIGYDITSRLGVEVRLKSGGVDLFEDFTDDFDDDDYTQINGAIQIGLTYTFDLNKK